jgi:hypothetical protein
MRCLRVNRIVEREQKESAGPFCYPPVFEPNPELEQQAGYKQEVGASASARCGCNKAHKDECRPQTGNTTVERLAKLHEEGFSTRGFGLALR